MTTPRESHVGAPDLRAATQSQSQSLALLRFARLYVLAALAVLLMLIPFDDPWLALTLRGLVVAAVVYAAMTAWRRWIISALLAASVLLMAPSFFGERTGWVGIGLAVVAAMFSVLRQLYRNTEKSCLSIPVAVAPLALLCAYWALVNSAATLVPLSYTLALIVVVIVFRGDAEAVRDALLLVSTFVALVGYAWFATTLAHAVTGIVPTRLSSEGYELRANFGYWSSGPFTITTNSTGFFGIRRASAIGGEPGTWALVATLGTCVAGALCRNKSTIRRLLLVGGALAVISSQSTGAFVAIIAAAAASLALAAALMALPLPAQAHKVIAAVFPSGSAIEGEIGFSSGEMAVGEEVIVTAPDGTELGRAVTDADGRHQGWNRFLDGPEPVGYDPSIIPGWTDADADSFGVLELKPERLRVMPGSLLLTGQGELLTWKS